MSKWLILIGYRPELVVEPIDQRAALSSSPSTAHPTDISAHQWKMLTPRQTFEEHSHDLELTLAGNLATSSNSSKLKTEWKHVWTTTATIISRLLHQKQCCVYLLFLWERPSQDFIHGSWKPLKVSFGICWCLSAITSPWPIPVLSHCARKTEQQLENLPIDFLQWKQKLRPSQTFQSLSSLHPS